MSDNQDRALQYLLHFGDKATRIYANQDAAGCYRQAFEMLEQQGGPVGLKAEVLEKLADAQNALGELDTALQHDLPAVACCAYTNLGMLLVTVDWERAGRYCEDGLALAKKIGDLSQQSWLYASMASSYCSLGGDCSQGIEEESERYYLEACAIAEESGEPQLLFPCYDGPATLYLARGQEVCQQTGYAPDAFIMLPLCHERG